MIIIHDGIDIKGALFDNKTNIQEICSLNDEQMKNIIIEDLPDIKPSDLIYIIIKDGKVTRLTTEELDAKIQAEALAKAQAEQERKDAEALEVKIQETLRKMALEKIASELKSP